MRNALRLVPEGGAMAVKLEGGYHVQGRSLAGARRLVEDALAVEAAVEAAPSSSVPA